MRLPTACLVVLVGPSGSGKSHWAQENFRADQVVASDALRALVGTAEHDQRAGTDAFAVLDLVLERRLRRQLLTVVDTLGLDDERRAGWLALARHHGVACHAVVFDTAADVCKTRNRARAVPVPAKVLAAQVAARDRVSGTISGEGFDGVHPAERVEVTPFADTDLRAATPVALRFGLQLSSFVWEGGAAATPARLSEIVSIAEAVGFTSIWVMDHLIQIPQVGRPWEDLLEGWTTLGWIAAHTRTARIGTLVTGAHLRHPAHLAKIVATLDVLSSGRAVCGVGTAWWAHENEILGIPFPTLAERYALLEDTLELLPLMWGPGSPAFDGRAIRVTEATCYPRPLQERVPILVGGSGERRTLQLAAKYADACNLFGDPPTVRRKVGVLARHCQDIGRDPAEVTVTHLSTAVVAHSRRELDASVSRLRAGAGASTPEAMAQRLGAGTIEDQIGRYQHLAEAGVQTAIVALPDIATPGTLEAFAEVIGGFPEVRSGGSGPGPAADSARGSARGW